MALAPRLGDSKARGKCPDTTDRAGRWPRHPETSAHSRPRAPGPMHRPRQAVSISYFPFIQNRPGSDHREREGGRLVGELGADAEEADRAVRLEHREGGQGRFFEGLAERDTVGHRDEGRVADLDDDAGNRPIDFRLDLAGKAGYLGADLGPVLDVAL